MPSWLPAVSADMVWAAVAALLAIGTVIFTVVRYVNPIAAKAVRVFDAFLGRPAEQGLPAKPGVIERLDRQDEKIAKIEAQVTPNHGSTNKLSEDVQEVKKGLAELLQRFEEHLQH